MNHNTNRDTDMQPIVHFDRQSLKYSSCRFVASSLSALTFSLIALLTCVAVTPAGAADRFRGIRFLIQAENGSPVSGATVELFQRKNQQMTATDDSLQTDDQGKGEFATLPNVQYLCARIQAAGFATEMLTLDPSNMKDRKVTHVLSRPAKTTITVTDPEGNPVVGAEIQKLAYVGLSGKKYIDVSDADAYLADFQESGPDGVLALPTLPTGAKLTAGVIHPDWVSKVVELDVIDGATATVGLKRGVPVSVHLQVVGDPDRSLDGAEADVIVAPVMGSTRGAGPVNHRFTISNNQIHFTTGRYNIKRVDVSVKGYFFGPQHVDIAKRTKRELQSPSIKPTVVKLQVHPKIPMRGRVVNHKGRPMKGVEMSGILIDSGFDKQDATLRERQMAMTSLGHAKTDRNGEYEIDLASGTALVGAVRFSHFSSPLIVRLDVEPESNETVPDIVLSPIPALRGSVRTEDQQSASDVIVKMDTYGRVDVKPVGRTDDAGNFQLRVPLIPYASYGLGFDTTAFIVAMDPKKQVGGITEIDLTDPDQTSNIVVEMKPQSPEWFLHPLDIEPEEIAERTEYALASRERFSKGIEGSTVPTMSEGTWINTDARSLADFRGKFVLLDFWFIGCGACEQDFPQLKSTHQVFPSDQFAIVAVHNNYSPAKEVREFVKRRKMPYAIVVDNRDGSIVKQYASLGLSYYPTYILLNPDGEIVINDAVFTGLIEGGVRGYRSLRSQKLELIRAALQNWDWDAE